ncbi:hypothetical protein GYMLUDRAFT_238593 [Collybiopsis luxurians FD-317 M1]|nr:hypothetical protein GYMLUDRAFT_238593 [Collybiopsis luxurians FD-317 M1]
MSSMATDPVHEFTFPRSVSPTKEYLKPNAHPYKIVTTSTALLSRSNSASKHPDSTHHHYVPQTPPSSSPGPKKHSSGHHRHRYSSSLSTDNLPRPLPVPPSPSKESPESKSFYSSALLTLEDLPSNPKLWTSSQLCSYLSTALRVKSGESLQLPHQVARDIAGFVRESKITGKLFLRLDEKDLEAYGVNKLWKTALLRASQNLRQNVLKGQIWGFVDEIDGESNGMTFPSVSPLDDVPDHGDEDEDEDTPHRRRRSSSQPQPGDRSNVKSFPFPNGLPVYSSASSSSSTEDLFSPAGISPMISSSASRFGAGPSASDDKLRYSHSGKSRHGRVQGMVDTFERSSSFDEGDPTSVKLLHEIKGMRELDLERLRKLRRERSGSTSSMSESGSFGSSHSPTSSSDGSSVRDTVESPAEDYNVSTVTSSRPLPTPPLSIAGTAFPDTCTEEEPSVEDLLAREDLSEDIFRNHPSLASLSALSTKPGLKGSFAKSTFSISKGKGRAKKRGGVYAWEDEAEDLATAPGKATAKRVPSQLPIPASMLPSLSSAQDIFGNSDVSHGMIREESTGTTGSGHNVEMVSSGNLAGGSGTHTPSRPLPEIPLHPSLVSIPGTEDTPKSAQEPTNEEAMLRVSIDETSGLLESFRVRLGEVERKVDTLEIEVKELEAVNAAKERQRAEEAAEKKAEDQAKGDTIASRNSVLNKWPAVRNVLSGIFQFSPSAGQSSSNRRHSAHLDPQTLSQLPPYVLLVGLGVCVVVLRVVARRLGGKR